MTGLSAPVLGGLLGGTAALGLLLAVTRVVSMRRPRLEARVLPYLRDVVPAGAVRSGPTTSGSPLRDLLGPPVTAAAHGIERVLGGAASVRRRLDRAGRDLTVHDFRVEQVRWGIVGFAVAAAWELLSAWRGPTDPIAGLLVCAVGFVLGVLWRDQRLSSEVRRRERAVVAEFPTVAELLALAVAAGEGPVAALDRVVRRSGGELSSELSAVLAAIRTGEPVSETFDRLAATTGVPVVGRFARGVAVAVERGTPLADVLHAQAADVREAGRRELIEDASRKEILMMIPVVFLVLPVTVLFAFWPGLVGLSLTAP
jgi:tight adherence protein C